MKGWGCFLSNPGRETVDGVPAIAAHHEALDQIPMPTPQGFASVGFREQIVRCGAINSGATRDLTLAAVCQRTRRIRPWHRRGPRAFTTRTAHVAARMATLDILSHGRAMWVLVGVPVFPTAHAIRIGPGRHARMCRSSPSCCRACMWTEEVTFTKGGVFPDPSASRFCPSAANAVSALWSRVRRRWTARQTGALEWRMCRQRRGPTGSRVMGVYLDGADGAGQGPEYHQAQYTLMTGGSAM